MNVSCDNLSSLKSPDTIYGYISKDHVLGEEICYERKWKSYIGLSKECITELLGNPASFEKNKFIYYSGIPEESQILMVLQFYFKRGKLKRIKCTLA